MICHSYNLNNISYAGCQIEKEITLIELENAVNFAKGITPELDRISYPMLQNMRNEIKTRVLKLFNNVYSLGFYPQAWKTAIIVPIQKPNLVFVLYRRI